jgi:hypothetical protein
MSLDMEEDCNAAEETQRERDSYAAMTGWCSGVAGSKSCRYDPPDLGDRGGLNDELFDSEIFYTLKDAQSWSVVGR